MGAEGLVPSLFVFGVLPSLSVVNKSLAGQTGRMNALSSARSEMATITAELKIAQAINSKLPSLHTYFLSRVTRKGSIKKLNVNSGDCTSCNRFGERSCCIRWKTYKDIRN